MYPTNYLRLYILIEYTSSCVTVTIRASQEKTESVKDAQP